MSSLLLFVICRQLLRQVNCIPYVTEDITLMHYLFIFCSWSSIFLFLSMSFPFGHRKTSESLPRIVETSQCSVSVLYAKNCLHGRWALSENVGGSDIHVYKTVMVKVQLTLEQATKAQKGTRGIAVLFLQIRRYMKVGGQRHVQAAFPPGKTQYPLYWRLCRPQCRSGRVRIISPPPPRVSTPWPPSSKQVPIPNALSRPAFKIVFLHAFAKLRKATIRFVMSVRLSVLPSTWSNSAPTGRIFMKFYIWRFFANPSRKFRFN